MPDVSVSVSVSVVSEVSVVKEVGRAEDPVLREIVGYVGELKVPVPVPVGTVELLYV